MRHLPWLLILALAGCNPAKTPSSGASPEKPKAEGDLAFATISKKAFASLGIQTQAVAIKEVNERLALTGWIMAKPGHEVTLTAPTAGYVHFPPPPGRGGYEVPIAGEAVKANQELLQLDPVLTSVEAIQVRTMKAGIETELAKAEITLKTAQSELSRTNELFKANLKGKQELEQAQKARDHAKEEITAAKLKLTYFQAPSITLKTPLAGTILMLHAGPGQYVPASAPLVTIIDLHPIWIRVPVPEFDLPLVDPKDSVTVAFKNGNHQPTDKSAFFTAKPTGRVAQVDPLKHTADLWYELEPTKQANRFVKDQMVTVSVPIGKKEKAAVVPYSAIIFDAHGQPWIYVDRTSEKAAKHQFERRRVELVTSAGSGVIIRSTLTDGERVVTNGAAVLFSREFHKTPVHMGEDE